MIDDSIVSSFMGLFKGRTDRYGSITSDGKGISLAGPVTKQHYIDHLEGKVSLGIYPLKDDGMVDFFAIDLDFHDEKKSGPPDYKIALKVQAAFVVELGMPVYISNSKSLKGFHIYGFFSSPVLAADIRKICQQVLIRLDMKNTEIFPKQDKTDAMVKYGNYINQPGFGGSHRNFLTPDQQEIPIETFLATVKKIDPQVVITIAQKIITQRVVADLEAELKRPKAPKVKIGKVPPCIAIILKGVGQGVRDIAAFTLASHFLTDQGLSQEDTVVQLEKWNAQNTPPLDTRDLIEKVRSAGKGYDVGCGKIKNEPLLAGFCVGEEQCTYIQGINKEKIKSGKMVVTSFYETETHLFEEIVKDGKPTFASYEKATGLLTPVEKIIEGDIEIRPYPIEKDGELFQSRTVLPIVTLPTGVEEYGNEQDLVDEIKNIISEYIDLPEVDILFCTYYIIMTWAYDRLDTLSYLRFQGDIGCLIDSSRVLLSAGNQVKINTLGSKHLEKIDVNLQLFGQKGALNAKADTFLTYPQQPVVEITTETGKRITGTRNHPLLAKIVTNYQVQSIWKRLDELRIGDKLKVVTKIQDEGTDNGTSAAYAGILGYMLGDGHMRKNRHNTFSLYISEKEKELLPKITQMIKLELGISPTRYSFQKPNKQRMNILEVNKSEKTKNIPYQGTRKEKRVPEVIWGASHGALSSFLKWFFTAEGNVNKPGRGSSGVALSQNNDALLREIQLLLLRFGIHSRINKTSTGFNLLIRRSDSLRKFGEEIGFETEEKNLALQRLLEYIPEMLQNKLRGRQPWEKITSIKDVGLADVYDISVPTHHRFVANGFISHNSGKSTCLDVIGKLCYKPMMAAGAVTPAPIYRIIRKFGGTLILDEGDMKFTDIESDMTKILNCFVPGTDIVSTHGLKIEDIRVGDLVLSHKGRLQKVWKTFERDYDGKIISITPGHSNIPLKMSPNHEIFVRESGNLLKKKAGEITKADSLAIPKLNVPDSDTSELIFKAKFPFGHKGHKEIKDITVPFDEDMAYFFGLYLAQGCPSMSKDRPRQDYCVLTVNKSDTKITQKIIRIVESKFGYTPSLSYIGETCHISICIAGIGSWLVSLFGTKARNKQIPEEFLNLPTNKAIALIRGMYDGDGLDGGRAHTGRGVYVSSSRQLIYNLRWILMRLGILPAIYQRVPESTIQGRKVNVSEKWELQISATDMPKLGYEIPATSQKRSSLDQDDQYWYLDIRKTEEEDYSGKLYNIGVENDTSYCLLNLSCGNCGIQRGRSVLRCLMDDQEKMISAPVYCPKVFSTRSSFTDKALESRCLTLLMEVTDKELPIADGRTFLTRCEHIRNKLLVWRFRNIGKINGEDAIQIKLPKLEPRLKQIARPMALIFKENAEVRTKFEEWMNMRQKMFIDEKAESPAGHTVHAIFRLATTLGRCYITTGAIAKMLTDDYKNEFKSATVGKILKSLKVSNKSLRHPVNIDGKTVSKVDRCIIWNLGIMKKLLHSYFQPEEREDYKILLQPMAPNEGDFLNNSPEVLALENGQETML
jgi:intein/homing endonuclease